MSAVATNAEMLVAPNVSNNAPKVVFRPVSSIATFGGPPAPQSMLESNTGRRAHATGCTFPTLIGGAGGPPEGGKLSHVFSDAKNTIFERTFFCAEPVAYLRNPNFSRATRFLVDLPAQGGAVRFFISGFVATALIWPPFWGGRHMTLPEACKTGIPDLGWLRAIFVRRASN